MQCFRAWGQTSMQPLFVTAVLPFTSWGKIYLGVILAHWATLAILLTLPFSAKYISRHRGDKNVNSVYLSGFMLLWLFKLFFLSVMKLSGLSCGISTNSCFLPLTAYFISITKFFLTTCTEEDYFLCTCSLLSVITNVDFVNCDLFF